MSKRVLIAGFKHETNTFSVLPTDMAAYRQRALHRGAEIARVYPGTNSEVAGFLEGCTRHGWEPILSVVADQRIVTGISKERIFAIATQKNVVASVAFQVVVARITEQRVVT